MAASKRCVICLNYLKSKKKLIPKHSVEEQTLIMYFLRKLALTPIPDDSLKTFLKVGNPSEFASFCYICEEQVKKCYDMHRKIMGMVDEIADIRKKLYQENFYESDEEDGEESSSGKCGGLMDVFNQLRQQLFSDFKEEGEDSWQLDNLITVHYKTASAGELESSTATKSPKVSKVCIVKKELVYEVEDAEGQDYSETIDDSYYLEDDNNNSESESEENSRAESRHENDDVGSDETVDGKPSSTQVDEELDEILPDKSSKDCPRCGNTFHSHACLRRHVKGTHLKVRDNKCPVCPKTFARKEYIKSHMHTAHPERFGELKKFGLRTKEYCCPQCPSKFVVYKELQKHINKFHHDDSQRYACNECDKTFKSKNYLRVHRRENHDPVTSKKRWPCSHCGIVLRYKGGLIRHMREKHEKSRVLACPHCERTSFRPSDLKRHIDRMHGPGNEKAEKGPKEVVDASVKKYVQCNLCWKSYSNPESLAIHQAAQHPEGKVEEGDSQFKLQPQDEDSLSLPPEEASRSSEEHESQSGIQEDEAMEEETSVPQNIELRQLSLLEF